MRPCHLLLEFSRPWLQIRSLIIITNLLSTLVRKGEARSMARDCLQTCLEQFCWVGTDQAADCSSLRIIIYCRHVSLEFHATVSNLRFRRLVPLSPAVAGSGCHSWFNVIAFNCPWYVFSASDEWINNFWGPSLYSSVCRGLAYQLPLPNMYENPHPESTLDVYFGRHSRNVHCEHVPMLHCTMIITTCIYRRRAEVDQPFWSYCALNRCIWKWICPYCAISSMLSGEYRYEM
jgi:hypothetical protein